MKFKGGEKLEVFALGNSQCFVDSGSGEIASVSGLGGRAFLWFLSDQCW